jgi:hypothetical protein
MKVRTCLLAMLAVTSILPAAPRASAADVIPLKVLYAGKPGSDREADFVALLEKHFAKVGKAELPKLTAEQAAEWDVVVMDWTAVLIRDAKGKYTEHSPQIEMPPLPKLGDDYAKPTVLIGAVAGQFGNAHKLKINWLCLCMSESAHGMKQEHEIFHKPLPVKMELTDAPTPANYREFPEGKDLPSSMKVLKMQNKSFPEIDPGLVSDPYGFEPTPDAEVMSSGINMKGPKSVAIGRHGNYLQWGFSAQPKDMTDAGRACFVNCVAYVHKFDGQAPRVKVKSPARDSALLLAEYMKQHPQQLPAERFFTPEVIKAVGDNARNYADYVRENLEYIRGVGDYKFTVDADAKKLGVSNRKVEFLEKLVALAEAGGGGDPDAQAVLKRYTDQSFTTPAEWRKWLDEKKDSLFFTDVGGYVWSERPADK